MTEEEKIFAGVLFCPGDPSLKAIKLRTHNLNIDFNRLHEDETQERERILHEILGGIG
ncbi:MAG: sugar O-acetyltransferase, partial [Clostridia bacterium]|nr:sugar O-acetyltransferase [Clostridia bacterium]